MLCLYHCCYYTLSVLHLTGTMSVSLLLYLSLISIKDVFSILYIIMHAFSNCTCTMLYQFVLYYLLTILRFKF